MKLDQVVQSNKSLRYLMLIFITLMTNGCANSPKVINILKKNQQITIQSPDDITGQYEFTFSNEKFTDDIVTGAATGAGAGFGMGAAMCLTTGPALPLCLLAVGGTGAVIGTAIGTSVGTIYGVTQDLGAFKNEHVTNINAKINAYIIAKKPQNDFLAFVKQNAAEQFQISSTPVETQITVLFTAMGLNHTGDDNVVLVTQSYVTVKYIDKSGNPEEVSKMFQYISPPNNIESWAVEDEIFYQQHFNKAYRTMAEDIMTTLTF